MNLMQRILEDPKGQMISKHDSDLATFVGKQGDCFPLKVRYTAIVDVRPQPWTIDERSADDRDGSG